MDVKVDRIECSTKRRAFETAQILAQKLGCIDKLAERQGLKPNDPLSKVLDDLKTSSEDRMLVGHLPYMELMTSRLMAGSSGRLSIAFMPATCVCLTGRPGYPFIMEWMITPECC
jgi:phosphohistidine phosphatase